MFFQRYLRIREWISKYVFVGKYFAGPVQGDITDIAQINAEKMLQKEKQMGEGEMFEGDFDLQVGPEKSRSRQQYQEDINEEMEEEDGDEKD